MLNIPRFDTPEIRKLYETRNSEIVELSRQGKTLDEIGKIYGISRQRVWAILQKYPKPQEVK